MADELQLIIQEQGLTENKVEEVLKSFSTDFNEARRIVEEAKSISVTDSDQNLEIQRARDKRIELKNVRIKVENTRKQLKEQSLREGKAIDGAANIIKALIIPVEEQLEKQEKFVELEAERKLSERLQKRTEELSKFVDDVSVYNLKEMEDSVFDTLLENSKKALEEKKAAELKAEKERIEREKKEAEERERIRLENEKLKQEAIKREEKAKIEREKQNKKLQEERKKAEAEKKKHDDEMKAKEEELRIQREAKERAEKDMREQAEREKKEEEERLEKERQLLLAPDKNKLLALAEQFNNIEMPIVQSEKAKLTVQDIKGMIARLTTFIEQRTQDL